MRKISILLVLLLTLLLTSCKGEELNFGKDLVKVNGMVDILTELDTKSSDVGIMDSIMAGYYINQQYKGKLTIVKDVVVAEEEYGIAARSDGAYTAKMISKTIIDLAKAVCAKLGIEAKFQIINWNSKVFELNSGAIDVIWNGMTITDEIKESTSVTIAYLKNKQVAVVRVEDEAKYKSLDDMKDATICVEAGSAGQLCVVKED